VSDQYHDDPIVDEPRSTKRLLRVAALIFAVTSSSFFIQSTLAGNISLNSNSPVEFGQGVSQTLACSGSTSVVVSPIAAFTNASGSGAFNLSGIKISNIPQSCFGSQFTIQVFPSAESTPATLFSTATSMVIANSSGTFVMDAGNYTYASLNSASTTCTLGGSCNEVTITFLSPSVTTTAMSKIAIQSASAPADLLAIAGIPTSGLRYGTVGGSPTGWLTMSTGFTAGTTWTVDGWVKGANMATENTIVMVGQGTNNACNALTLRSLSANSWSLDLSCVDRINFTMPSGSMANNTWIHVAAVGDTNGMSIWVNGQALSKSQCGQCTNTGSGIRFTNSYTGTSTQIGAWSGNGWISQGGVMNYLRLSTSAIWPSTQSTIPVPSSPPTALASTKLLLTSTSTSPFIDSSTLNQTLTLTGSVAAAS
jgi:hypothetical protein